MLNLQTLITQLPYVAIARIILRYGAVAAFGAAVGGKLLADPDVVAVTSVLVSTAAELAYIYAKKRGWTT